MATIEPIKVTGLKEFRRNLGKVNADLPKCMRLANNDVAELVVAWIKPQFPRDSGAGARSVRVASTQKEVRIREGGAKVPYVPWLDFGGRVGPKRSVKRKFYGDGRYLYPGLAANREALTERLTARLIDLCRQAGVEVTS